MARVPAGVKRAEIIELLEIKEQLKPLNKREKELVDVVKRAHDPLMAETDAGTITRPYGAAVVTISDFAKFAPAAFAAKHPAEKYPQYYASTVDPATVPDELRGKFVVFERRLTIVRAS